MSRLYLYLEAFWCQTLVATPQEHIEAFLNKPQWDYREANHCRYHQQKLLDACEEDCWLTVLITTSCLKTDCCHGAHQDSDASPWGKQGSCSNHVMCVSWCKFAMKEWAVISQETFANSFRNNIMRIFFLSLLTNYYQRLNHLVFNFFGPLNLNCTGSAMGYHSYSSHYLLIFKIFSAIILKKVIG